jgi:hypothetical protein
MNDANGKISEATGKTQPRITVSLAGAAELPPAEALAAAERAGIRKIAIPGRWLEDGIFEKVAPLLRPFDVVEAADIAPSNVSSNVASQSPPVIDAFVEKMALAIERAAALGVPRVSLSLGEPEIPGETGGRAAKTRVLKRICPYLVRNDIRMRLPLRVPRVGAGRPLREWTAMAIESMCANIGLELRIHPHEPGGPTPPDGMEGHFLLLVESASFVFEPEIGNSLSEKLLMEWFDAFESPAFGGALTARPRVSSPPALESALSALGQSLALG